MTRSLSRMQMALLALVVCAGVAVGGWAVHRIGARQGLFADTYELRAGFQQAHGLDRGTPVRVRGVEAGQVIAVELPPLDDPDGKVVVRLRLRKQFQPLIPADSKAVVMNEGVLGGRLINIVPGKQRGTSLADGEAIAVVEAPELTDVMQEATQTLREIRDSNGTIAKLVKSDEAHKEMLKLVQDTQQLVKKGQETFDEGQQAIKEGKETLAALKQDAEAIKRLPLIRGYVEDPNVIIYRPDQDCDKRPYAAIHLFEPGRAILTEEGKAHLSALAPWLEAGKVKGSELVVVSYADPASTELSSGAAHTLTLRRSEVVVNFLKDTMKAHKTGWLSSRNVTALGMGHNPPPVPDKEPHTPERTEVLLFTPR